MNLCLQGIFILEFVSCVFSQKCVDKSSPETARLVPSNKFCCIIPAQKMFTTETEMETPLRPVAVSANPTTSASALFVLTRDRPKAGGETGWVAQRCDK